jgi:hypothetical protein
MKLKLFLGAFLKPHTNISFVIFTHKQDAQIISNIVIVLTYDKFFWATLREWRSEFSSDQGNELRF